MIEIKNLQFGYNDKFWAVNIKELKIENGEHVCFFGLTGSGKTTLLRLICGLEKAPEGTIFIDGKDRAGVGNCNLNMSYLLNPPVLMGSKSVLDNMRYVDKVRGAKPDEEEIKRILFEARLGDKLNKKAKKLPASLQMQLNFARVFYKKPRQILVDIFDNAKTDEEVLGHFRGINWLTSELSSDLLLAQMVPFCKELRVDKFVFCHFGQILVKNCLEDFVTDVCNIWAKLLVKFGSAINEKLSIAKNLEALGQKYRLAEFAYDGDKKMFATDDAFCEALELAVSEEEFERAADYEGELLIYDNFVFDKSSGECMGRINGN